VTHQATPGRIFGAFQRYFEGLSRPRRQIVERDLDRRSNGSADGKRPAGGRHVRDGEVIANKKQVVRSRRLIEQREVEAASFRFLCAECGRYGRGKKQAASQPAITRQL
jgi:hypothetical protein